MRVARAFRLPITADHDRARPVGLHAHGRACRGRAKRSDLDDHGRTASPVAGFQPGLSSLGVSDPRRYAPAPSWSQIQRRRRDRRASLSLCRGPRAAYARLSPARGLCRRRSPVRYDASYHLDAGDKLRVVVYGQEGLTNTYAIDAGGSITMPLIGSVPARGRTPAGLAAEIAAKLRDGFIREPSVAVEIEAYRPFFILGEVAAPGQYPYVPNMTRRERGRHRRRLLAARRARPRDGHPYRCFRDSARYRGAARHLAQPRRYRAGRRTLVLTTPERRYRRHFRCLAKSRGCAARRYRRWSCRSSPVRRSESHAARRDRRRPRPRAAWP